MLKLIQPATVEPISLTQAKSFARVYHNADDSDIAAMISAARQKWETESGYFLSEAQYEYSLTPACSTIRLPLRPVLSVESITTDDDTELAVDEDYTLSIDAETGIGTVTLLANVSGDVAITFAVGFPNPEEPEDPEEEPEPHTAPALAKHALKSLVAHWYNQREAYTEGTLKDTPAAYASIVRNFRLA